MKVHHFASIYFAIQGIAVVGWWLLLFFVPASRVYFQMGDSETILLAFWLPDLFLLAAGSFVAAVFCFFDSRFLSIALWFVVGAVGYATFYCFAFALMTDTGWLGVTLMFPAMILSGNFAVGLSPTTKDLMFRRSNEAKTSWILTKTSAQIIIVWFLILAVFPFFITILEIKLGIPKFSFPFQKIISAIFFCAISSLGVSGAYTMARIGRGTPLPLDAPSNLVVAGVYSFVRNPMAISGIGQGLAVGLFLGSPLVLLYALTGGLIWQMIFRRLEEDDLLKNFGSDYESYRRNVRCWIPRLKPYQIDSTADSSNSIESPFGKM
ncbi:MAG TPA: isoprenylcysteine carboxylmethyltransferase family protein [Pyrinomonadaceae bacterium]|nr:isoprenylcysteine carboxylmethyltransferase family protein [Pyrinomonadaceae bacterium]